jgi:hypothetical protein
MLHIVYSKLDIHWTLFHANIGSKQLIVDLFYANSLICINQFLDDEQLVLFYALKSAP